MLGMYHALVEARVPFELVHEAFLTPDRIDQFKLIVLADRAALSNDQCAAIKSYVSRGGSVLATFASSLYDEAGAPREGLRPAGAIRAGGCGLSPAGQFKGPVQNPSPPPDTDPQTGRPHPTPDGMGDPPRIITGVSRAAVRPPETSPSPLPLTPTYPDLPMEDVYPRV